MQAYWNLTLPKIDIDPNDKINFCFEYLVGPLAGIRANPKFLLTRNPTEGNRSTEFKNIIVHCYDNLGVDLPTNNASAIDGTMSNLFGRF